MQSPKLELAGLCAFCLRVGLINEKQAKDCQAHANKHDISIVSAILEKAGINDQAISQVQSQYFGLPYFDIQTLNIDTIDLNLLNETLILRHQILPLRKIGSTLRVATSDALNQKALHDCQLFTGLNIELVIVDHTQLNATINQLLEKNACHFLQELEQEDVDHLDFDVVNESDLQNDQQNEADDTPIVKFINKVILDGINKRASDIHFEPYEKRYRIRLRIDGILTESTAPPPTLSARLTSRLKIMSKLDIAERRVPQDGRFKMQLPANRAIDFRVSTCPTLFGEKVVLRILDPSSAKIGIDALGYDETQKDHFLSALSQSQGMILVTGPTGSGKTVSLYTALSILNVEAKNISTAEDPVEINLSGINQVNIHNKAGLTFASALKAFLRQDPDIIMVGEIRDLETAQIAIKAAQTGHLVLSTLHTNSAPETLIRLANMGIEPYNIASSIRLIIAQRLARRLCEHCKTEDTLAREALLRQGVDETKLHNKTLYKAVGCGKCSHGYSGRIGVFEVMPISSQMQQMMMQGATALDLAEQARSEGVLNINDAGIEKILNGTSSLEEISRMTGVVS